MTCKKIHVLLLLDHQVVNLSGGRFLLEALLPDSRSDVDLVRNDSFISVHLQLSLWMLMLTFHWLRIGDLSFLSRPMKGTRLLMLVLLLSLQV